MDPSAKHFFTRGAIHHESKQMPGLTKLFLASKTSSHPHDCLTWFLHFGAESEEITEALTLREDFRAWQEMMLRALKHFPSSPLTKHGPHLQSYLSPSQAEGEGKMSIRFIIS